VLGDEGATTQVTIRGDLLQALSRF
jgi:hypothetical protein